MLLNIFKVQDYREVLKFYFDERCARNKNYSLRAFARDLDIPNAQFIDIMNNKAGMSRKVAIHVCDVLKLNAIESDFFITLVNGQHARAKSERLTAQAKIDELRKYYMHFSTLKLERFELISNWNYFLIMETCKLDTFDNTFEFLLQHIPLAKDELLVRLRKLESLGIINLKDNQVSLVKDDLHVETPIDAHSKHVDMYHRHYLELSIQKLATTPVPEREYISSAVAINRKTIPEIKIQLRRFMDELLIKLDNDTDKDVVYNLGVQLFSNS